MGQYGEFNEGVVTDTATTVEQLGGQLGSQRTVKGNDAFGDKQYTLVQHLDAIAVTVGMTAAIKAAAAPYGVTNDASGDIGIGVGIYVSIPVQNEFCWIQTGGYNAAANVEASVVAGDALGASAVDGEAVRVVTTTTTTPPSWFARALTADVAGVAPVLIRSPYGAPSQ